VDAQVQVALVHRPKYDDWSLPKGKLEPEEPWVVGGVREVREETGFVAVPGRTLGESRYRVLDRGRDAPKTVRWWAMRCLEGAFTPSREVDALRWVPGEQALAMASAFDVAPLTAFVQGPVETTTVLLLDGTAPEEVVAAYLPERVLTLPQEADLPKVLQEVAFEGRTTILEASDAVRAAYGPGSWALSLDGDRVVDAAPLQDP
jgi:ADP-ribose pyrophosphatase YjhB (NUDIX family)